MYNPFILFSTLLNHGLALKRLLNLSFYAPKILQLLQNFTTPFPVVFRPTPFKNPFKNISPSLFLHFLRFELNDKICVSFLDWVLVCMRRRSRSDRGRTRRRAVPRASVRGPVPRPRTRRTVPRSGLPGRLCERQVQSHPLMHILSQFYKHNLLACFTKLHMLCLLKTWLDSHPLICYNHSLTT